MWIVIALAVLGLVIGLSIYFIKKEPSNPTGTGTGRYATGQRNSDMKWQILWVQTADTSTFAGKYQVLYNPQVSTDATLAVFDTKDAALTFYNTKWNQAAPSNKSLGLLSTNLATADYTSLAWTDVIRPL